MTNGHVIAQLGGRNQDENVSFGTNQAVLTDRDWGSTMKPITAYAPAIESGVYTSTAQSTNDSVYYWPGTTTQLFNWDLRYNGWMTIKLLLCYREMSQQSEHWKPQDLTMLDLS